MHTRVHIRPPLARDERAFLAAVEASRELHRPWIFPPSTAEGFMRYLDRMAQAQNTGFLVRRVEDDALAGAIHVTNIVHGVFLSGYLDYYAFAPLARQGYMREGLLAVIGHAFGTLGLHRLEANIQPGNIASLALVKACGFAREGFSPRYLKIDGAWRDHERWAILAD